MTTFTEKVEKRLEREVEKSQADVAWALEKDEDAAATANSVMSNGIYKNLLMALLFFAGVVYALNTLTAVQFWSVSYLVTGVLVVRYSDYSWRQWQAWFAVVAWLPVVILGSVKKIVA